MSRKIQLYLINGFLGSGKTTLLRNLFEIFEKQKCGVLMNEFGEIGIDGQLLPVEDIELVEINNGSIFCSCLHGDFIKALIEFTKTDIDILLIEASGLSDPASMRTDLQLIRNKIGNIYDYTRNICLVDAQHFIDLVKVVETIRSQIKHSSLAVVNKIDLVDESTLTKIEQLLDEINPAIRVIKTSYGYVTPAQLAESPRVLSGEKISPEECLNTPETRSLTVTLTSDRSLKDQKVRDFFGQIADNTRRMKGFIELNTGWHYIDSVNGEIQFNEISFHPETTQVVVIFRKGIEEVVQAETSGLWEKICLLAERSSS